jgi:anthranilate synthase/aminodeoxychorismate synthase-like glutamine amidotransferase
LRWHRGRTEAEDRNPRILLLDNYDSFTWNLVQYLRVLGASVEVVHSDRATVVEVDREGYDAIVLSPGPGRPEDAGISIDLVRCLQGRTPLLGVCLGLQVIGQALGARIVRAPELVHGKTSAIHHDGRTLFEGLPQPFEATRYHSLMIDPTTVPSELEVTAKTADGVVMAIRHRSQPVEGVQFHPESVLTPTGMRLLENFLRPLSRC